MARIKATLGRMSGRKRKTSCGGAIIVNERILMSQLVLESSAVLDTQKHFNADTIFTHTASAHKPPVTQKMMTKGKIITSSTTKHETDVTDGICA